MSGLLQQMLENSLWQQPFLETPGEEREAGSGGRPLWMSRVEGQVPALMCTALVLWVQDKEMQGQQGSLHSGGADFQLHLP